MTSEEIRMGMLIALGGEAELSMRKEKSGTTLPQINGETTATSCFDRSSWSILNCRNSVLFLSEANFVSQQDLSTKFEILALPGVAPSSHIMHCFESEYFIIGQEAITIGSPMLKTAKTIASVSAIVLYVCANCMYLAEREYLANRSCDFCATRK